MEDLEQFMSRLNQWAGLEEGTTDPFFILDLHAILGSTKS
jgi:hypothetical protein